MLIHLKARLEEHCLFSMLEKWKSSSRNDFGCRAFKEKGEVSTDIAKRLMDYGYTNGFISVAGTLIVE
jgi:glycine cleavage system protein P-like pyridoxal-binding family